MWFWEAESSYIYSGFSQITLLIGDRLPFSENLSDSINMNNVIDIIYNTVVSSLICISWWFSLLMINLEANSKITMWSWRRKWKSQYKAAFLSSKEFEIRSFLQRWKHPVPDVSDTSLSLCRHKSNLLKCQMQKKGRRRPGTANRELL